MAWPVFSLACFTTVTIQLPVLTKLIDVTAERNNGELHFGPVQDFEVDLGPFGVSCLVRGNAEGFTNGFGNDELRVSITLSNIHVPQSGSGLCILPEPSPDCTLEVISEGQRRSIP